MIQCCLIILLLNHSVCNAYNVIVIMKKLNGDSPLGPKYSRRACTIPHDSDDYLKGVQLGYQGFSGSYTKLYDNISLAFRSLPFHAYSL